jgi:hypothetical protein
VNLLYFFKERAFRNSSSPIRDLIDVIKIIELNIFYWKILRKFKIFQYFIILNNLGYFLWIMLEKD